MAKSELGPNQSLVKRTPEEIQARQQQIGELIRSFDCYGYRGWRNQYILLARLCELQWLLGQTDNSTEIHYLLNQ